MTGNDNTGITCITLEGEDRVYYPAALFGVAFELRLEPLIFSFAEALSEDYSGALWKFLRLESEQQGFLMVPEPEDKRYRVRSMNGYECNLSALGFGVTCALFSYSHASFQGGRFGETCAIQYQLLLEFASGLSEFPEILRLTD